VLAICDRFSGKLVRCETTESVQSDVCVYVWCALSCVRCRLTVITSCELTLKYYECSVPVVQCQVYMLRFWSCIWLHVSHAVQRDCTVVYCTLFIINWRAQHSTAQPVRGVHIVEVTSVLPQLSWFQRGITSGHVRSTPIQLPRLRPLWRVKKISYSQPGPLRWSSSRFGALIQQG